MTKWNEIERKCASVLDHFAFWIQRLWYVLLLTFFSVYVGCHFNDCVEMNFFEHFNGRNIIFIIWLFLLIVPLFGKLEAFGVNVELRKEGECITKTYDKLFAEQEEKEKGGKK